MELILKKIRKKLIQQKKKLSKKGIPKRYRTYSLCDLAYTLRLEDKVKFIKYLLDNKKGRVFYNHLGEKLVIEEDRYAISFWHWRRDDFDSRMEWLNEHIKLNKNK